MDEIRVFYSRETDSLDIWLDDPAKESVCEEIQEGVTAKKDKKGNIIGFEIISVKVGEVRLPIKVI